MIYLVEKCVEVVDGRIVSVCGGWCCKMLDFSEFPNGRWVISTCDYLKDGLCVCYNEKPLACSGSPFFDYEPSAYEPHKFPVAWCAYRKVVLDYYNVPYQILGSGQECIERYAREGLGDFERFALKYFHKRTLFWEKWESVR